MTVQLLRSFSSLKEIWASLLAEENLKNSDSDDEYQALFMLLDTAISKTSSLSSSHLSLKTSNKKLLSDLEKKDSECNQLKLQIQRLENTSCQKCSSLEADMVYYRKKALEAHNRMKSIANILRIGENLHDSQSPRKNSAFNLVSQMLLGNSPKRKKRCIEKSSPVFKVAEERSFHEMSDSETVIPETLAPLDDSVSNRTPKKSQDKADIIMSPDDSPMILQTACETVVKVPVSINLPLNSSSSAARKNLSSDFEQLEEPHAPTKLTKTPDPNNSLDLNGSLAEYVKSSNSEFDKIWFNASSSKSLGANGKEEGKAKLSTGKEDIVEETPEKSPQKKVSVWKMKAARGPSEHSGKVRLKQMKLSVSQKQKVKDVDLSTLSGYDGGSGEERPLSNKSSNRKSPSKLRNFDEEVENLDKSFTAFNEFKPKVTRAQTSASQVLCENDEDDDTPNSDIGVFKPLATSTQSVGSSQNLVRPRTCEKEVHTPNSDKDVFKPTATSSQVIARPSYKKAPDSPNYNYKRDAVRKKSERAKLEGWDCAKCAEYYTAIGETDPSKVKGRMNKCSRHRDKFKPLNNTPPGFWNPIMPDTEECRERGYYTSFRRQKSE